MTGYKNGFFLRLFTICLVIATWPLAALGASQTQLLDVRLGMHQGASRAVLSCRGARPTAIGPLTNSTYPVVFTALDLPDAWEPSRLPPDSCFTGIGHEERGSGQAVTVHTGGQGLWVENVVLKEDARPDHYRVILDFWPVDSKNAGREDSSQSPDGEVPSASRAGDDLRSISSLPQGKRMPVRRVVARAETSHASGSPDPDPQQTELFGFRVGEHRGYTRVVVEARGQKPEGISGVRNGTVRIDMSRVLLHVPREVIEAKPRGRLRRVRIEQDGIRLDVQAGSKKRQGVILDTDPPRSGAYRIVVDLADQGGAGEEAGAKGPARQISGQDKEKGTGSREIDAPGADTRQQNRVPTVRSVTIGWLQAGAGPELKEVLVQARREFRELMGDEWTVHFERIPDRPPGWDLGRTRQSLLSAARDPGLDMLWAFGPLAVLAASRLDLHSVPVLGVSLWDVPHEAAQTDEQAGTDLVLIAEHGRVGRDLEHMQRIFGSDKVRVLVEDGLVQSVPGLEQDLVRMGRELGLEISVHPISGPNPSLESADSPVYLAPGLDLTLAERTRLFEYLHQRGVPSFSAAGRLDVQAGALAGARPEIRVQMARRTALNTREMLWGRHPQAVAGRLETEDRLCINAQTAGQVGFHIGLDLSLEAEILRSGSGEGQSGEAEHPVLSLEQAMHRAARAHPDLQAMRVESDAAKAKTGQAAAGFWPRIEGSLRSRSIDKDRAEASFGLVPENRTSGRIALRQMVFNDSVISTYRSSGHKAKHKELQAASERLDVMHEAGKHYWAVLQARSMTRIERQNLQLIQDNLHWAKVRRRAGYAGPEEVLRWKTRQTRQQERVLQAESDLERAWVALNRAMGTDQERRWELTADAERGLDSSVLHRGLSGILDSGADTNRAADFALRVAGQNAPELSGLEEALRSAQIRLGSRKRSLFVPKVGISLEFEQIFDEDRPGVDFSAPGQPAGYQPIYQGLATELEAMSDNRDRQEWSAAVELSLPLFEGGRRVYEIREARAEVSGLHSRYAGVRQLIEQQVRSAVHALSASLPGMRLSRRASSQAEEHLHIIQDKYAQGQVSILELLDAQNEWHVQEQRFAASRYAYARDLLDLQRAMAWMECTKTDEQKSRWLQGLRREVEAED
ncbi:TolC family protein [Desulfovermiculus halophilus]|jgi:outer membrane protein TolC|uniref:TolC family protein n=1 Tax=Desulfovermiculus halophilus TaxID=339722 RepID=UPI0004868891|nr:TolC family protein [Desulfovermiculus halophilus]